MIHAREGSDPIHSLVEQLTRAEDRLAGQRDVEAVGQQRENRPRGEAGTVAVISYVAHKGFLVGLRYTF